MKDIVIMMKEQIEDSIKNGGKDGFTSLIRSQKLINNIHELAKIQLIESGVDSKRIFPPLNETKPELKIAGFLKQKNQDITVVPNDEKKTPRKIDWGPLKYEDVNDAFGADYTSKCIVINIRSQMSSIEKNTDTLFERTFAEAVNLRTVYKDKIILGELYLIPVYAYDPKKMSHNTVSFVKNKTNLEKYISFFSSLSSFPKEPMHTQYNRCALMIVDFRSSPPKIYNSSEELKEDNLIDNDFPLELEDINVKNFASDLLTVYNEIYPD